MATTLLASAGEAMRELADHVDRSVGALQCWKLDTKIERQFEHHVVEHTRELGPAYVPRMAKGEEVQVWSRSQQKWIERASVQHVAMNDTFDDGASIPAGSVKVRLSDPEQGREGAKWVPPDKLHEVIRRLPRPRSAKLPPRRPSAEIPATAAERQQDSASRVPSSASEAPTPRRSSSMSLLADNDLRVKLLQLRDIEDRHKSGWAQFADEEFPERPVKLDGKNTVSCWGRTKDIGRHDNQALIDHDTWMWLFATPTPEADWRLFRDRPLALDVQQGELGDCWFLSSLGALAGYEDGRFVRALLPQQTAMSEAGAYVVRLCMGGRWRNMLVDDRLPCIGGGRFYVQLACCVTHRLQIWASIVEKAYAKACGSYERIVGGEAGEALTVLTGWPCSMIRFCQRDFEVDNFWATLCSSRDAGFLMTCSTCETKSSPLEPFHVFLLMDVFEVPRADGGHVRLVKVRNQQEKEKGRWTGPWCDECPNWTPELRERLGCPVGGVPGVFFMALGDFLRQFAHCTICRIRSGDNWHEERRVADLPSGRAPDVGLRLETFSGMAECSLSLSQPEERARTGPLFPNLPKEEACIGFVLLKNEPDRGTQVETVARMRCVASVSADCWLEPSSSYTLVPLSLPSGPPVPGALAAFSSKRIGVTETALSNVDVRLAWAAYARKTCEHYEVFRGAKLYMGKAEGGAVVALAENHSQAHFGVELTLTSSSLRFSRDAAVTMDWLPPGYAQVLQVAVPAEGSRGSAGWHSRHKFQMTSRNSSKTPHEPPLLVPDGLHCPFRMTDGLPPPGTTFFQSL